MGISGVGYKYVIKPLYIYQINVYGNIQYPFNTQICGVLWIYSNEKNIYFTLLTNLLAKNQPTLINEKKKKTADSDLYFCIKYSNL